MKASILSIGDELLNGQTINTNASWMAEQLNLIGIRVHEIITVSDSAEAIQSGVARAMESDIVLVTGGLGPTNDDITKTTLAQYFHTPLIRLPEILEQLQQYFRSRGMDFPVKNLGQADMPESCEPIPNHQGTAWGMWFQQNGKVLISMPGVPYEMKAMMEEEVLPRLRSRFPLPVIVHQFILTAGIGESILAEKLEDFEAQLPAHIRLAYLPTTAMVKLRLTAYGDDEIRLKHELAGLRDQMMQRIGRHVYGEGADVFEGVIGRLLRERGWTMGTAESCTGGLIAHRITRIAGSSQWYHGSIIAYDNQVKISQLGVNIMDISQHGAVSEQVVQSMLKGVLKQLNVQTGIAVSGIAGPDGGTLEKPVGTVWIAYGSSSDVRTKKIVVPGNRVQVMERTAISALELFRKWILETPA